MGIVRDLYYARKMSAGLKLPAPTVALLIKRLRLAAAMGGGIEKTVSGTMVHITDALAKAALSVLVNITPIQPGSGDPSPLNVRPISGLTGLSVYVGPTQDQQDAATYAIDWTSEAGTVYGGTLDVVTGVLTVDMASKVFNGSERWDLWNGVFVNYDCTDIKTEAAETSDTIIIADRFKPNGVKYRAGCGDGNIIKVVGYNPQIACYSSAYADEVAFKASLANSPMTVCYELATPLTYQLSAQEVQMLLGENYVWSSSGDTVSVTYYAEGNANDLQSLNILLGGNYSNPKTADDVSDKEALEIILGGNK